jgi:prepilin-type N-terminal cleavage/methylation domain-containing protein
MTAADVERDERGFTLIELVIVSALLAIVLVVIFSTLTSAQKSEAFTRGRAQVLEEMRDTMDRMTRELRQATNVVPTPSDSHIEFDSYDLGTPVHLTYDATGTALTRQVGTSAQTTLMKGLTTISVFSYVPDATTPQSVTIDLIVKPSNLPNTTVELKSTVELRNIVAQEQ